MEIIEQIYDFCLVKERHRSEKRASKRVLQQDIKSTLLIKGCGRAQKRVFVPAVDSVCNHISQRFPKNVLLSRAMNFLSDRLRTHYLHEAVVEKWHPSFDRMSHFHAVAQQRQEILGQSCFGPKV